MTRAAGIPPSGRSGASAHVIIDTDGLLLGVLFHAADIQDADGLGGPLKRVKSLHNWPRAVFADNIYNRLAALLACFVFSLALIIVRRPAGSTGFVVQPRRRVVERVRGMPRTGWLGRWRRLSKDHETLPEVSEAMVTLAAIRLVLHRLAHPCRRRLLATCLRKQGLRLWGHLPPHGAFMCSACPDHHDLS
ncbi:transposase [Dankookia sp. GCM10030260]|uniref:transposase n=1 Tax=Dankookia sp. GCM10030260 TaxID=3273390 RepID=UPI0036141707